MIALLLLVSLVSGEATLKEINDILASKEITEERQTLIMEYGVSLIDTYMSEEEQSLNDKVLIMGKMGGISEIIGSSPFMMKQILERDARNIISSNQMTETELREAIDAGKSLAMREILEILKPPGLKVVDEALIRNLLKLGKISGLLEMMGINELPAFDTEHILETYSITEVRVREIINLGKGFASIGLLISPESEVAIEEALVAELLISESIEPGVITTPSLDFSLESR